MRLVVRIAAVGVDGDDGRIVGHQIFAVESFHEPLLNFVFRGAAVARPPTNLLKCRGGDRIHRVARAEVRFDLLLGPGGFELRHQVGRAEDVFAQAADQFDGAARRPARCEHDVIGRVLHGNVAMAGKHRLHVIEQLLPAGVLRLLPGRESRCPASILCTNLTGSPSAGIR